jgi:diguanylate cyclase (GGDEF)-like protein
MKVLIAEDDENSRTLLETVLGSAGFEVFAFDNGLKAYSHLQANPVDLIISDILMPEMDGYGLCRAVKQSHHLEKIPFIFYTATYTSSQDERFAMSLGANKMLLKPMLMPDFIKAVEEVMASETAGAPKSRGLYRGSPLKLDKQHADRVRAKLDDKVAELNAERKKLMLSEARFKDFAEAAADWFWEADEYLKLHSLTGGPKDLHTRHLGDLAVDCQQYVADELLNALKTYQAFADFVICFSDENNQLLHLRMSGKPVFEAGKFVGYRGVGRDVTEMVALSNRLEFMASHDELTGLPNRSLFRQRLEHAIIKAERASSQVLLMFLDLDNFKAVNDTQGHDAGDALLVLASKRITELVRASDVLCRIGGDEFVMVMEGASPQDAHRLVREIINAFTLPFQIKNQPVYCTVSIGVSVYPDDTKDPQTMLVYADLAMYRAKQKGRNDFEFYTNQLNVNAHQWLDMENGIRNALKQNQFYVVYQPQVAGPQNQLIGMEALLRWRHPERGLIPPAEFIKVAEQSSLINQVGDWVFDATCKQMRAWLDAGYSVPRVSVNVSARQLRFDTLSHVLIAVAAKYKLAPSMLCIEITEHALMEEVDVVKKNMREIKQAGFSISLDDFGMGHSSLLYLKRWSVDELKIDRSFVDGLVANEEDRVIVKAIVALGDALGLTLVGEGVENQQQADILTASGCVNLQGYLYSPPVEPKELLAWLKKAA